MKSTPSKPSTVLPQAKQWSDTEEVDAESSSSSDGASDVAKKDVSAVTVPPLPEGIQERTKARVAALNAGLLETPADKATTSTNGTKVSSTTGKASPTGNKAKRAAKGKGRRGNLDYETYLNLVCDFQVRSQQSLHLPKFNCLIFFNVPVVKDGLLI